MSRWLAASLCVVSLACAAAPKRTAQLPFIAIEITEDGDELRIPNTGVTDIDVNSVIELRLNEPVLRPAMQLDGGVDPEALARLSMRSTQLRRALDAQRKALERLLAYLESPPPPAQVEEAGKLLGTLEEKALNALEALYPESEVEALLSRPGHSAYTAAMDAIGTEIAANNATIARLEDQLDLVRLRVLASLQTSDGPIPQHLEGYDAMAEGAPQLVRKIAWAMPADLQKQVADAQALAKELQDLKGLETKVRTLLEQRAKELIAKLEAAGKSLLELQRLAETWKSAPWTTVPLARSMIAAANSLEQPAVRVLEACTPVLERLPLRLDDPARTIAELANPTTPLRTCLAELATEAPKLRNAALELAKHARALEAAAHADAALATKLGTESLAQIERAVAEASKQTTDTLLQFWKSIERTVGQSPAIMDAPPLVAGAKTLDRPYADLQDTKIDLTRTARSVGDTLHWRAAVIQDGFEARSWSSPTMRVVSAGAHLDVSAAVIFVKPFEEEEQDSSFPAAAAVTAALHYRIERDSGQTSAGGVWNFLNPGLGIHIAYLDLGASSVNDDGEVEADDPPNEIGVGGVVQLFGDVLTAGVGYDLQAARSYWFLGFGLKTLTDLGVTVPGSPSNGPL